MESKLVKKIELQTPCFVVNVDDFRKNIRRFQEALSKFYDNSIVSYSVKTNSLPVLIETARLENCYCEVVSYDEYALVKRIGVGTENIVYNGPMKDEYTFIEAASNGAYVNIETKRELDWIIKSGGKNFEHLGIRLNVNLGVISPDDSKIGEESSRFGFDYNNGEFQSAVNMLNQNGIDIKGIHIHRTSATRSLAVYENICRYVSKVIREMNLELEYIDIGGGFFGNYKGKPDFIEYAQVIRDNLCTSDDITIIVEPGNALVASSVEFITSVIDKKKVDNNIILTIDGSRMDVDPFFHKSAYNYSITTHSSVIAESRQIIAGCTCLENDILITMNSEIELEIGDRLHLYDQGAYTMTLTPGFIRLLPRVYAYEQGSYRLKRTAMSVENWISTSILEGMQQPAILFSNAGRRGTLIKNFKKSLGNCIRTIATDNWCVAPALFVADEYYVTPPLNSNNYIDTLLDICKKENVKAITTCIDPEIEILADNREIFIKNGILPLCPDKFTADLCYDKYKMYEYLLSKGIRTVKTYRNLEEFNEAHESGQITFPVFIKPRCGSGSVGTSKINNYEELAECFKVAKYEYIIQEYMEGEDFDADVYIDVISNEAVAIFAKKKIETRIGGASKTISFKDDRLFGFVQEIVKNFKFYGPVDMDFFYQKGQYYLSEINPRFGGAYLHAFGAGVDFPKLILNNIKGKKNNSIIGNYDEDVLMMMYDEVIITTKDKLRGDYND